MNASLRSSAGLRLPVVVALLAMAAGCTRHPAGSHAKAPAPAKKAAPAKPVAKPKPPASEKAAFDPHTILSWPRMRADRFGCLLEKTFHHRDARFDCALTGWKPGGDPCKDTKRYYEGPAFPGAAVASVDPRLDAVQLSWEHGELQAVSLTFKQIVPLADLVRRFGLPPMKPETGDPIEVASLDSPVGHDNVMSIQVEKCGKSATCLTLQGFEHMGAGDADCGGSGAE